MYLTENEDYLAIKAAYSICSTKLSHFKNNPVGFWLEVRMTDEVYKVPSIHLISILLIHKHSKKAKDHLCQG